MSEKVMEQGTIEAIRVVLDLLRDCLVVNGVSLGYDKQDNNTNSDDGTSCIPEL